MTEGPPAGTDERPPAAGRGPAGAAPGRDALPAAAPGQDARPAVAPGLDVRRTGAAPGGRSRGLQRLLATAVELDAEDERAAAWRHGATPLAEVRPRTRVRIAGVLSAVTYRPKEGMRALVGRLYDGSASVDLVWLGRRAVPGIEPGRRLLAEGMVYAGRTRPTIFNPAYELIPEEPRP